jgi:hypothetical protein
VAPAIKDKNSLPDYAKPVADKIEKLGFKWEFDYEFPVPDPDKTQRVQIRNEDHIAKPADVNVYAAAMKRGDKFPPGVVTKDGRFVDFNTRAKAAHKLGWPHFPAFVINVNYGAATESERERVQLLGASFNTTHGKRLDRNELAMNIRFVANNPDWTAERVAALLGISQATVNALFAQARAEQRAKRLGVTLNGSVTASNKAILGQRSEKLTDAPFKAIAMLAQDAGLTHGELRDLCNRVQVVEGSEAERVAVVEKERGARAAQIAHHVSTGKKKPPLSTELRKRLTFTLGYEGKEDELVDFNPETASEYMRQLERGIAVLRAVADAQRTSMSQGTRA